MDDMTAGGDFQPYQTSASRVGKITEWVDEKGFGWIESGGKRVFVHIKNFDRGQGRPKKGEEVRFIPGMDPKGRSCAKRVNFVNINKARARSGGMGRWFCLCLMLLLPLLALLWLPVPWWAGAGAIALVSAVSYGMYAHDKRQAISSGWRVSESSLHMSELLGGWPGAFLAQRKLRHKCSKPGYQVIFWMIVMIYQFAAVDLMLNHRLSRAVVEMLK